MILNLTPLVVLALLGWAARVLARRAWQQMPLEKTPTAWSRSQRRNRAGATVYNASRATVHQARISRHRNDSRTKGT